MPFVQFPTDWEIKFMQGANEEMPIYFAIRKEGAPNVVSVAVFAHNEPKEEDFFWEIANLKQHDNGSSSIYNNGEAMVPLKDVEGLLHHIQQKLYEEIRELGEREDFI